VVEFRIAHMGMDLRRVLYAGGGDPEAFDGPVEIGLPFASAQRQTLAQSRLIDLDDWRTSFFQIHHFVADREGELAAGRAAWLIVAYERPVEDRDWTGEHALHRPIGQRLRVAPPIDRHGFRPRDV